MYRALVFGVHGGTENVKTKICRWWSMGGLQPHQSYAGLAGVLASEKHLFDPVSPKSKHFLSFDCENLVLRKVLAWWANVSHTP